MSYKKVLKWLIILAIFAFMGKMVWDNWKEVREASFTFNPFLLPLSTLVFAFSYFIQIWAWYLTTLRLDIALSFGETLASWFYSQLGKYLPGKVWLLLSRFYFYESKGKSKKAISVALYIETVTLNLAAGLIFLGSLISFPEARTISSAVAIEWFSLLLILSLAFLHPRVLEKGLNWILVRFRRDPVSLSISYPDILGVLLVCLVAWIVGGFGFYLFVDSVFSIPSRYILYLTGALAFSSTLGLIALFAPSGLGVREGVLVYLLSFVMPAPVAVIISILTRLWMTLIEIGLIGVIYLSDKFRKGLEKKGPDGQTG